MSEESKPTGPDFSQGVPLANIPEDGVLLGHAAGEPVLVARSGGEVFAIGAECTHYHGPLAEGLRVGDTIRCPWHHACFSLRTGEALRAPALDPVVCWRVEQRDGTVTVHDRLAPAKGATPAPSPASPSSAAGRRGMRQPRCCGAKAMPGR
jgi:nitrite reductase/ring-hydroxylating ferredoxin subunit